MDFVFKRSYRGPLKAAILDWAGTTTDYGCMAPTKVFIEVFERHGVPITMEQAREPMGAHKKDHIRMITKMEAVSPKWEQIHGRQPTEQDVEAMFKDFVPLQLQCMADHADLIPGTLEAVAEMRRRGLKIGTTTGYTREMLELLLAETANRGYKPDVSVCVSDVPAGRPQPWMCFQCAMKLGVYPMEAIVKIGDTLSDIFEGLNAGMWTVGVAKTGNEMGLTEAQMVSLDPEIREARLSSAYQRMHQAGAHYVVDGIGDVPPILEQINARLSRGERP